MICVSWSNFFSTMNLFIAWWYLLFSWSLEAGENAEFNNALADSEEGEVQSSSPLSKQFVVLEVVDGKLVWTARIFFMFVVSYITCLLCCSLQKTILKFFCRWMLLKDWSYMRICLTAQKFQSFSSWLMNWELQDEGGSFQAWLHYFLFFFFVSNVHSRLLIGVIFMNLRMLLSVHCLYKTNKLLKDYGGSFVLIRISLFGHGHFSNDVM